MKRDFGQNSYVFRNASTFTTDYAEERATAKGVSVKTLILMGCTFLSALVSILLIGPIGMMQIYLPIVILDLVALFAITFSPRLAKTFAIPYAILEGLMVGSVVGMLGMAFPEQGFGIAGMALVLTIAVFLSACVLYISGAVRATTGLRKFLFTASLSLVISGLVIGIMSIFNPAILYTFSFGPLAIIIELIYVAIASVYCVISLDNAYMLTNSGLEKDYEWYAAFGIIVNVIWLFYEILRFLILIFASSNDN